MNIEEIKIDDFVLFKPWLKKMYSESQTFKKHGWGYGMTNYMTEPMQVKQNYSGRGGHIGDSFGAMSCTWHSADFIKAPDTLVKHQKALVKKTAPPKWWTDEFVVPPQGGNYTTKWVFYYRPAFGFYDYHKYWQRSTPESSYTSLKDPDNQMKWVGERSTACFASIHGSYWSFKRKYSIFPNKVTYLRPTPTQNEAENSCYEYYKLLRANGVLPPNFNCKRMAYKYNAGLRVDKLTLNQMFAMLAATRVCSEKQAYHHALLWLINEKKMADFWIAICAAASVSRTGGHHWIQAGRLWDNGGTRRTVDPDKANKLIRAAFAYREFFQAIPKQKKTDMQKPGNTNRYNSYTDEISKLMDKYKFKKHYRLNDLLTLKLEEVKLNG